mgnify:CR=1 FL=1
MSANAAKEFASANAEYDNPSGKSGIAKAESRQQAAAKMDQARLAMAQGERLQNSGMQKMEKAFGNPAVSGRGRDQMRQALSQLGVTSPGGANSAGGLAKNASQMKSRMNAMLNKFRR